MIGPLFEQLLKEGKVELAAGEQLADVEQMYTLILKARGRDLETLRAFDERLALAALCKISWPGKMPGYKTEVNEFLPRFRGIARSNRLGIRFQRMLSKRLIEAEAAEEVSFSGLESSFRTQHYRGPLPRKIPKGRMRGGPRHTRGKGRGGQGRGGKGGMGGAR